MPEPSQDERLIYHADLRRICHLSAQAIEELEISVNLSPEFRTLVSKLAIRTIHVDQLTTAILARNNQPETPDQKEPA